MVGVAVRENSKLAFAIAVLLGFAAMMAWVLAGPPGAAGRGNEPRRESPERAIPEPPAAAQPQKTEPPAQPAPTVQAPTAPDLFAGPLPDFMQTARTRVAAGQWLDIEQEKQLHAYGRAHRDDARPQLLLAWDSVNREWWGIAVRMYRIAYHADARAKDEPSMLRDLLQTASRFDKTEYREASALIREAYGLAALTRLDPLLAELRARGDVVGAARLQRLRNTLSSP